MKQSAIRTALPLLLVLMLAALPGLTARAQGGDPSPDPSSSVTAEVTTETPSETEVTPTTAVPPATATLTPTEPPPYARPLVVIHGYSLGDDSIQPGETFDLSVTLQNNGQSPAANLIAVFESADFFPLDTGGVRVVAGLGTGKRVKLSQPMQALPGSEKKVGIIMVKLSYVGPDGVAYSEVFTISAGMSTAQPVYTGPAAATATPTAIARAQLVVSGYKASADPLQPGTAFDLELEIRNLGNSDAKAVTLVLGGGGADSVPDPSGTAQAGGGVGGISGSGSELTNFAPLGSSNLFYMGDIAADTGVKANQKLIVNVTTAPGAYPLKLSFVYTDSKGNRHSDDQVITLLVYSLPQLDVSFYRDPGFLAAGQMGMLPIQVTNLGRKGAVLGTLKVSAQGADLSNHTSLVGNLDPGNYFTLDANVVPLQPGPLELVVTINYSDDFNQSRTVETHLTVEVQPAPEMPPEMPMEGVEGMNNQGGGQAVGGPETFWQKVVRFFRGLFGLGSAAPSPDEMPIEPGMEGPGMPGPGNVKPMPAPAGGKG